MTFAGLIGSVFFKTASFLALSNTTVSQKVLVAAFGSFESSDVTQRSCIIGFTSEAPRAL